MRKVYQTRFGGSSDPVEEQGNCFQACVATLFGLELEDAFNPNPYREDEWFGHFKQWLKQFGMGCAYVNNVEASCGDAGLYLQERKSITLTNPEDTHVVVAAMEDGYAAVLHDPNPHAETLGEIVAGFIFTPLSLEKFGKRQDWSYIG